MPNRLLLALAERSAVRRFITNTSITKHVVQRFVAGETINDAIGVAKNLRNSGLEAILDYLGENVTSEAGADDGANTYLEILERIASETPSTHISVKLTQLGLDLSVDGAVERMQKICAKAVEVNTVVAIDMESHKYTDKTIETYRRLRSSFDNLVLCLQSYLARTPADIASLLPLDPAIRLCKGAYNEPREIMLGRRETTEAYETLLHTLLTKTYYTAIATHDDRLIRAALRIGMEHGIPPDAYEFQMLFGVRRDLHRLLNEEGMRMRIYVPFGDRWYPYLMRRLAERPGNIRFFLEALLRG